MYKLTDYLYIGLLYLNNMSRPRHKHHMTTSTTWAEARNANVAAGSPGHITPLSCDPKSYMKRT